MKTSITLDVIKAAKPGEEVWDTRVPGLVVRTRESGQQSYAVVYGRGKRVTLGRVDALTPDEARKLAKGVFGDIAHGKDPQAERRKRKVGTLREFVDQHYASWARANRPRSADGNLARLARFGALLDKHITDLSAWHLEQWRTGRRKDDISNSTINRDLDALRGVLTKAVEWKVIAAHPMADVKRVKTDVLGRLRYRQRRFNAWREERGYKTLPDFGAYVDHLEPITLTALNTGLRRGELFNLQWSDIDLVALRLTVRGAGAKTGLTRYIPLNTDVATVLTTWRTCTPHDADAYVFPGPQGERMTTLKTSWAKVMTTATLKDFTFHDLRHSFASRLVQAGVDLNVVRELLGHSGIAMTLRYSHLAPEHKAAAVAKLVQR
jgi:integrase